jgi:hypothetical protein
MANYNWANQTAWSQGAWSPGSWLAGSFSSGAWHLQGPANSVAPVASGNVTPVGSTLTATSGTWSSGNGTITYAYQWQRNGQNIANATANTYVLAAADTMAQLSCNITATDSVASATRVSNALTTTF